MSDERTEPASPKKRKKAREDGQVAKSAELVGSAILLAALWAMPGLASGTSQAMSQFMVETVGAVGDPFVDNRALLDLTTSSIRQAGAVVAPLLGLVMVSAVALNVAQVGFFVSTKKLAPQWSHLNVLKGLQNLVSPKSWVNLLKSGLKAGAVGWVAWSFMSGNWEKLFQLHGAPPNQVAPEIARLAHGMAFQMASALTVIAALDYAYQRWQHERQLKMTKQEVKDEFKESEGNPEIKGRIRQRQREMGRRRMIAAVPAATVILANPTHFSVALQYEQGQKGAPRVVAKGQDLIALRIREIARDNGVPVIETPPLARALFKSCDVGQEIPASLFRAVAEVLALVWRVDHARQAR